MTSRLSIIIFSIIALIVFFRCNTDKPDNKLIEGDLYYDWLRFGSFYNQAMMKTSKNNGSVTHAPLMKRITIRKN